MGSRLNSSGGAADSQASESAPSFNQDYGIQAGQIGNLSLRDIINNNTTNHITNVQEQALSPDLIKDAFIKSLEFEGMNERHDNIEDNTPDTCQWLLETDEWREWQRSLNGPNLSGLFGRRDSPLRRLFWIKGQPGAGKSTYMKFAVRHAQTSKKFKGNIVLAHFFNARALNDLAKSVEGMYRTLLTHLLRDLPPDTVQKLAQSRRTEIKSEWKLDTLSNLFKDVIRNHITRPVACFIDALDECVDNQVQTMVRSFCDLAQTKTHGVHFRACFASRYYPSVTVADGTTIDFRLDQQPGHLRDIETYIKKHLLVPGSRISPIIHEKVREKARGVFIWCKLAIEILNKEYDKGGLTQEEVLREKVNTIPEDLHRLFSAILGLREGVSIANTHAVEATTLCMQWALFSQTRDIGSLWWAIQRAVYQPEASTMALEAQYGSHSQETMKRYILNLSKGLLEVVESEDPGECEFGSVEVIHESVRDFLLKGRGLAKLMGMQLSTEDVGRTSQVTAQSHENLKKIAFDESFRHHDEIFARWPENLSDFSKLGNTLRRRSPLLLYSRFWIYHANTAGRNFGIDQVPFLKKLELEQHQALDKQWKLRSLIWHKQHEYYPHTWPMPTTTQLLAEVFLGPLSTLSLLIMGIPVGPFPKFPPRYLAGSLPGTLSGTLEGSLTDLLIYENAEVLLQEYFNQPKELYRPDRPSFHHCLKFGYKVSGKIFQTMVDINLKWHRELMSPRHGVLKQLALDIGDDIMDFEHRPKFWEEWEGLDDMLILGDRHPHLGIFFLAALLPLTPEAEEVVATWERENRGNPATLSSFASFVLLALQHTTQSEASQIMDLGELLLMAAHIGDEALAQLLLDKFDTPCNVQRRTGKTPLHYAVRSKDTMPMAHLLLSRTDIRPELPDSNDCTALHHASWHGNSAAVNSLLASEMVNVNSQDNRGNTPLHVAMARTHKNRVEVVRALLSSGKVDVNMKNNSGQTPRVLAKKKGGRRHIRSLEEAGFKF